MVEDLPDGCGVARRRRVELVIAHRPDGAAKACVASAGGRSCLQHIGKLVQHVVPACTYLLRHLGQRVGQRARLFVRSQNCREATSSRNIAAMV